MRDIDSYPQPVQDRALSQLEADINAAPDDDESPGDEIECRACSIAGGADKAVYHSPPACPWSEEEEAAYQRRLQREREELLAAPLPPPVPDGAWHETAEMNAVLSRPDRFEQE